MADIGTGNAEPLRQDNGDGSMSSHVPLRCREGEFGCNHVDWLLTVHLVPNFFEPFLPSHICLVAEQRNAPGPSRQLLHLVSGVGVGSVDG